MSTVGMLRAEAWGAVQPLTMKGCARGRGSVIAINPSTAVLTYCLSTNHVIGRVATVSGTGTRTTSPASAAPKLQIAGGASGQWVDELVVWAGDFQTFTTEELANLHDLADVFGDPMDQYEEDYGAPICWQATARMPDGTVWRDSGCGPCPPVVRVPRGASDIVVTDDGRPASPRVAEG